MSEQFRDLNSVEAAYLPPMTHEHQAAVAAHDAIASATSLIENQWELYNKPTIDTDIDGITYHVRLPHLRGGKHGAVAIMEWRGTDGGDVSCVLRKAHGNTGLVDAQHYLESIQAEPSIAEVVPQLYGMVGEWAVIERLQGLELDEITGVQAFVCRPICCTDVLAHRPHVPCQGLIQRRQVYQRA